MRTFIFDAINRYKRYSENLEVKIAICNKSWWVFNDSGEKELYIFLDDGTLYITLNGRVTLGTWKYLSANSSLIISGNGQSYMVHAAYMDNTVFALQVDGTNEYAFLIEEDNRQKFLPKTFSDVESYFHLKEKKVIKQQELSKQELLAATLLSIQRKKEDELNELLRQEEKAKRLEEERIRQEELKRIAELEVQLKKRAAKIKLECEQGLPSSLNFAFIVVLLVVLLIIVGDKSPLEKFFLFIFYSLPSFFISGGLHLIYKNIKYNGLIEKWKKEHPDDPVIEYL